MELEKEIDQSRFRNEAHKLGVNLLFTYGWFYNYVATMLKKYGITTQQFNVLRILRGHRPHPASIKFIRERMLDKMSDASRIVEKLRTKGLVERKTCPADRRSCEVVITPKGMQLLSRIDKEDPEMDKVFSRLSQPEIKQLNQLLDKMRGK